VGARAGLPLALLVSLALVSAASGLPPEDAGAPAITNQDVVRMVSSGMPEERILARIRESSAAYDLSPDMIDELKLAGVSETILGAMRERARKVEGAGPASSGKDTGRDPGPPAKGWIEIVFDDDPSLQPAENSVAAPAEIPDPNSKIPGKVELAFVVICTHPVHVPDHWDAASPLGPAIGRHQVLFFEPSTAQTVPKKKERVFAYLRHPASWRIEAEADEHRGVVGVAARIGSIGPYALIAGAPYEKLIVGQGLATRIEVRMRAEMSRMKAGRDPLRPMKSDPGLRIIGSAAALSGDLLNRISLKVSPPAPPDSASPSAPATPPPPR
jgi:hypothetical protein